MKYEWQDYSIGIQIPNNQINCYGKVYRNGKTYYRNYKRELKIKEKYNIINLINEKINIAKSKLNNVLELNCFD